MHSVLTGSVRSQQIKSQNRSKFWYMKKYATRKQEKRLGNEDLGEKINSRSKIAKKIQPHKKKVKR